MDFERDIRYRPNQHQQVHQSDGLWWQIAIGIFVGQLMTAAVAGIGILIMGGIAASQTEDAMRQLSTQAQRSAISTLAPYQAHPARRPLESDERCENGVRLKHISGGWADMPYDPC